MTAVVRRSRRRCTSARCARATSSRPTAATAPSASGSAFRMEGHGTLLGQHHDLLPRRRPALFGDRNLSVIYVFGPAPAGLLPLLERRPTPAFSSSTRPIDDDGELSHRPLGRTRREERCIEYVREALGAPRPAGRDRERPALERVRGMGRAASATGASSSPATPRTSCRRPAASAATRASRTRTTSRGSSRSCCRRTPAPSCSRHVRGGAAPGRRVHRRAGVHALRDCGSIRARHGEPAADRRGGDDRPRLPLPLERRRRRPGRRLRLREPARADRLAGDSRPPCLARTRRGARLDARPRRPEARARRGRRRAGVVRRGRTGGGRARPPTRRAPLRHRRARGRRRPVRRDPWPGKGRRDDPAARRRRRVARGGRRGRSGSRGRHRAARGPQPLSYSATHSTL